MADQPTEPNLRYPLLMRWAPPFIALLGVVFLFMGDYLMGGLLVVAGLIFWFIVRRRKTPAAPGADAAQQEAPPTP